MSTVLLVLAVTVVCFLAGLALSSLSVYLRLRRQRRATTERARAMFDHIEWETQMWKTVRKMREQ